MWAEARHCGEVCVSGKRTEPFFDVRPGERREPLPPRVTTGPRSAAPKEAPPAAPKEPQPRPDARAAAAAPGKDDADSAIRSAHWARSEQRRRWTQLLMSRHGQVVP